MLPEALKAMGIAEAGSEPAYPTQNAAEAKAEAYQPSPLEIMATRAKEEIARGPLTKAEMLSDGLYKEMQKASH
jgi:hypothetical protein